MNVAIKWTFTVGLPAFYLLLKNWMGTEHENKDFKKSGETCVKQEISKGNWWEEDESEEL